MNSHKAISGFIQLLKKEAQSLVLNIHNDIEDNAKSGLREHNSYWLSNDDGVQSNYSLSLYL